VGNVRGRPDLLFVAADQRTVQGRHQVHLDEVATVACPEFVGGPRVLRAVSRSTTVRNDLDGGFLLVPAHSRTVLEGEKWKSRVTDPLGSATIVQRRYPDPPRVMYVMDGCVCQMVRGSEGRLRALCPSGTGGRRQFGDHVVDALGQSLHVTGLHGREHPDTQLVTAELAVGLGVHDTVGTEDA